MNKICVIGVYFGKLPNYFNLWLSSCRANPQIDFLIFSDNVIPEYENVKTYVTSLDEMRNKASAVLGFDACLDKPYKCCDYRPVYGLIFADYISEYDYWGHCDFDLIFGDLNAYFVRYELYKYERFLPLGHLSLYKNTTEVNNRYKCSGSPVSYKTVFTDGGSYNFDEMHGINKIFEKNKWPFFSDRPFSDISVWHKRYKKTRGKNYKYQIFLWENGKTYREYIVKGKLYREECLYVHFQKRPNYDLTFNPDLQQAFYMTNKGFILKEGETNIDVIKKYNPYPGVFVEFGEWVHKKIRRCSRVIKGWIRKVVKHGGRKQ